jgi:hypothetical protein
MLLHNLNSSVCLCNEMRLLGTQLAEKVIGAQILTND